MLTIKTMGRFCIVDGEKQITDDDLRSTMLLKLLLYIILYRDKELTNEDIASAIWQEEEIDNPAGALKNLMYRLRKALQEHMGDEEYILTKKGAYSWNPKIPVSLDVEWLEHLIGEAKKEPIKEKAIATYETAIAYYKGDFATKMSDLHWVATRRTYYHSMYLSAVKSLAELYVQNKSYEALEKLCSTALEYETADEQLFCYQIEARMRSGKTALALETYEKARAIIEKELGLRKTIVLTKVYEELLAIGKGQTTDKIEDIYADIEEDEVDGVFLCGYPVFKEICNLEARRNLRTGEEAAIVLLALEVKYKETEEIEAFRIRQGMVALENIIKHSLRIGDVASRYSDSQFIVLLSNCVEKEACVVAKRIEKRFAELGSKFEMIRIQTHITKLENK